MRILNQLLFILGIIFYMNSFILGIITILLLYFPPEGFSYSETMSNAVMLGFFSLVAYLLGALFFHLSENLSEGR